MESEIRYLKFKILCSFRGWKINETSKCVNIKCLQFEAGSLR
jgi:hypothetical protein